jgi:hypothetical protein
MPCGQGIGSCNAAHFMTVRVNGLLTERACFSPKAKRAASHKWLTI